MLSSKWTIALLLPLVVTSTSSLGAGADRGSAGLDARWRYEQVEDTRYAEEGQAWTVRLHPWAQSPKWQGWFLRGGLDLVRHLGSQEFNDGLPGSPAAPMIADPAMEDLDELYAGWSGALGGGEVAAWAGRRGLSVDNSRFIGGGPSWRQGSQSFDGLGAAWSRGPLALEGAWFGKVLRPPGNRSPLHEQEIDGSIARVAWTIAPALQLALLGGRLDYADGPVIPRSASNRLGLATVQYRTGLGVLGLDAFSARVRADAGRQSALDPGGTAAGTYLNLQLCLLWSSGSACGAHERLGGNGTRSLQTPLAALHAFNGYADRFLATPAEGLRDSAISAATRLGPFDGEAAFRIYTADTGALRYGRELDLMLSWKPQRAQRLMLKGAWYRADDPSTLIMSHPGQGADVSKIWLQWELTWQS